MAHDVDDVPVGVADEEPSNTTRLGCQWVDDVVAEALCLGVRVLDAGSPSPTEISSGDGSREAKSRTGEPLTLAVEGFAGWTCQR